MKTIICRHCDMVSNVPKVPVGYVAKCVRCEGIIFRDGGFPPSWLFALCLAALILLLPAFYLPLISVHLLGITEATNLLKGAIMMIDNAPVVALVVLFCAVVAPTLLIFSITITSACLSFNYRPTYLPMILKITYKLQHWSMLDVYIVSLLVAIFKLINFADLFVGAGLYFFIALLLVNMIIVSNYNHHALWERYING